MPVGLPQLGPISGIVSPTCFETYFLRRCATSRPSGSVESHSSRCIQPPYLASASVASRIAVDGALGGLDEADRIGERAGFADGLVDRDGVDRCAFVAAQLVQQRPGLLVLGDHVVVGDAAVGFGACDEGVHALASSACLACAPGGGRARGRGR